MSSPLISTEALALEEGEPRLKILDASWRLDGSDTHADFVTQRIPGAVFFDLEANSDSENSLPHMLPGAAEFGQAMGALGLHQKDAIVVYDSQGLMSAARVWWMLKTMGATDVRVLDGGLPKWLREGRPIESGSPHRPAPTIFTARLNPEAVVGFDEVRDALAHKVQVIDARAAARFLGEAPEPRPGLRAGHMPGALNVPFGDLLQPDKTMKPIPALRDCLTRAGVVIDHPPATPITSCGSGVTAAIVSLALARLGVPSRLYDGSWADWGSRSEASVAVGPD